MIKTSLHVSFRHIFVAASLTFAGLLAVGCAVSQPDESQDQDSSQENVGEAEEALTCCQEGTLVCPTTGDDFDYGLCVLPHISHSSAIAACKAVCGSKPCTDTGWHSFCY
ncbi:MAG: hypothetical protein U0441_06020 [Polyangiaceae bacterium]